ncbi:conserved hypothetical protein [Pseudomonas sp. 9AZ]|nr:conserved hypothetical protein [Pseudomonas sp. 9AZ]
MIVGQVLCTECTFLVNTINPNNRDRLCLNCGNRLCYQTTSHCNCDHCGSENTKEMFHLTGKEDEKCPKCNSGFLYFSI